MESTIKLIHSNNCLLWFLTSVSIDMLGENVKTMDLCQ